MKKRVDLPEKKYEGYIFDLDGTLVDSMPLHYKAWRKALARAGAPDRAVSYTHLTLPTTIRV